MNSLIIYDILSLISAVGPGHDEIIKALCEVNSPMEKLDKGNCVALMKAIGEGKDKYIDVLKEAYPYCVLAETKPPLMHAKYQNRAECVKLLLQAGADVNRRSHNNSTAVMEAAIFGADDIVKVLAESGADVNAANDDGDTALMSAAKSYFSQGTSCLKMLLCLGAKINMLNSSNRNALEGLTCSKRFSCKEIQPVRGMCLFLFAAGETISEIQELSIPDYLLFEDLKFCLKNLCRMAIRKHLLNLFGRIPRIGSPL